MHALWAHSFEVIRTSDDRIILTENSCSKLRENVRVLSAWAAKTGSKSLCPIDNIPANSDLNTCSLDATECLPEQVAKYQGLKSKNTGPNCWNLALVMSGVLPNLRYSTMQENTFYLQPPLCRRIGSEEQKKSGDVGAIRYTKAGLPGESKEIHGFIYISEDLAFSKDGFSADTPYSLTPLESVLSLKHMDVPKECRVDQPPAQCKRQVDYYRCISFSEYLDQTPNVPKQILEAFDKIGQFENCIENENMGVSTITQEAQNNIKETAEALAFYLNEQRATDTSLGMKKEDKDFLLGALQLRLMAIELGLKNMPPTQRAKELDPYILDIRRSYFDLTKNYPTTDELIHGDGLYPQERREMLETRTLTDDQVDVISRDLEGLDRMAIIYLGRIGTLKAAAALLTSLNSYDSEFRKAGYEQLAKMRLDNSHLNFLAASAANKTDLDRVDVRVYAIKLMGKIGSQESLSVLQNMIKSETNQTIKKAIKESVSQIKSTLRKKR